MPHIPKRLPSGSPKPSRMEHWQSKNLHDHLVTQCPYFNSGFTPDVAYYVSLGKLIMAWSSAQGMPSGFATPRVLNVPITWLRERTQSVIFTSLSFFLLNTAQNFTNHKLGKEGGSEPHSLNKGTWGLGQLPQGGHLREPLSAVAASLALLEIPS